MTSKTKGGGESLGHDMNRYSGTVHFFFFSLGLAGLLGLTAAPLIAEPELLDLGLTEKYYRQGQTPEGWSLRKWPGKTKGARAEWDIDNGIPVVKLHSSGNLTFLEKNVSIDLKNFPLVSWKWKVITLLKDVDERTRAGDDHPLRIFFVFEPDQKKQSLWFRLKRFIYLDRVHGHSYGGRFIEYLWSSHLEAGEIISDPGKPWQKLMVVAGGSSKLGQWLSYNRDLYQDFKTLYGEEPRRLIFIGILNDTDQTGQAATSYIADLKFSKAPLGVD